MYAAYKADCFGAAFAPDMNGRDFQDAAVQFLQRTPHRWIIRARRKGSRELQPVALFVATSEGHRLFPHAVWFPWATARNRLEGTLAFLNEATESGYLVIIATGTKFRDFFTKLMSYGIVRRIGVIPGWFSADEAANQSIEGPGTEAMFFYARKR